MESEESFTFAGCSRGYNSPVLRPWLLAASIALALPSAAQSPLTSEEGVEDYPSFSPDGLRLAYAASEVGDVFGGDWDVWLVALDSGERRNLTEGHDGDDRFPSFSPDGASLSFWSDREGGGYFVLSLDDASLRRLDTSASYASGPAVWLAEGRLAAVVRGDDGPAVELVSLAGGVEASFPLDGVSTRRFDLSASPDGRYLAYVDGSSLTASVTRLFVLDRESGRCTPVTDGASNDWSPFWSPSGDELWYVSNRSGPRDVYALSMDAGRPASPPRAVTTGRSVRHAALSPDGRSLVTSRGGTVAGIWRAPVLDRPARWDDAEPVIEDDAYVEFIGLSPDGTKLVTTSDASGNPDLWIVDLATGAHEQRTDDPTPDWGPSWSPDGERIAFYAYRSGNRDVWMLDVDRGDARQLTRDPAADMYPEFSPDGETLVFYSVRSGNRDVWTMPANGGDARQLTDHPGDDLFPQFFPDGERVLFHSDRDGVGRMWSKAHGSDAAEPVTDGPARFARFSPDGTKLFFTGWGDRLGNLYERELESGRERAVTDLKGRPGNLGSYVLATDGASLYFAWERNLGDLYLERIEP